ncbi:metal ABC transporter ATP-binding protein [Stratiformator vulcanicus]|uniref:Zinc import ATP-binding protein ZnuC n=1 Tax=Stratiformator vulcanicus TaxID=2527980 RepID=A0A517QZ92_9PLAN|nr:metal ABC transporter ATP-binding protein [Stratiformator vulcanicus]QDT36967.1 Zinc import ATP-binding protein ZnuC [Stratiformator vulcanicus]
MTAAVLSESSRAVKSHATAAPLTVREMTVAYRSKPVVWDVSFELRPSTLTAVIGPNGAGKSTLIKAALDLVTPSSGAAQFWGQQLNSVRRRVAYVPQRTAVDWDFPVTALQVVTMGLYGEIGWLRPILKRHRNRAAEALEQVGLSDLADRQISQLSGGQQQRVFLARALVQDADFYLMDEPFAGVDAATESAIVELLRDLRSRGKSALVVHHDLDTVTNYFDAALLLNMRLVAAGSIAEVFNVENLRRTYGGRLALLDEAGNKMFNAGGQP